jgi:hypothetical protein
MRLELLLSSSTMRRRPVLVVEEVLHTVDAITRLPSRGYTRVRNDAEGRPC